MFKLLFSHELTLLLGTHYIGIKSLIAQVPSEITWDLLMPSPLEPVELVLLPVCDARDRTLAKGAIRDGSNVSMRNQTKELSQESTKKQA